MFNQIFIMSGQLGFAIQYTEVKPNVKKPKRIAFILNQFYVATSAACSKPWRKINVHIIKEMCLL